MMTFKEFGEKLDNLNKAYEELKKKYRKPEVGGIFEVAGIKWRVLDKFDKGYLVISDDFHGDCEEFDSGSNNWGSSDLRSKLEELRKKIEDELGDGALVEFERDLLSLDGQTEYGTCMDYVSLLSVDEYRKYRKLLPNMDEWWWLLTPYSTPCNGYSRSVAVVSPSGGVNDNGCSNFSGCSPILYLFLFNL